MCRSKCCKFGQFLNSKFIKWTVKILSRLAIWSEYIWNHPPLAWSSVYSYTITSHPMVWETPITVFCPIIPIVIIRLACILFAKESQIFQMRFKDLRSWRSTWYLLRDFYVSCLNFCLLLSVNHCKGTTMQCWQYSKKYSAEYTKRMWLRYVMHDYL